LQAACPPSLRGGVIILPSCQAHDQNKNWAGRAAPLGQYFQAFCDAQHN
jgi:hypothetical protein